MEEYKAGKMFLIEAEIDNIIEDFKSKGFSMQEALKITGEIDSRIRRLGMLLTAKMRNAALEDVCRAASDQFNTGRSPEE